ncbi:MAG: hypothetical protein QXE81_03960 [Desulfurococcaceae archaeon]
MEGSRILGLVLLVVVTTSSMVILPSASITNMSFHLILDPVNNTGVLIANVTLSGDLCEYYEVPLDIIQLNGDIEYQYYEIVGNISVLGLEYTNNTIVFVVCKSGSIIMFFTLESAYREQSIYELVVNTEIFKDYIPLGEVVVNLVGEYEIFTAKIGSVSVEIHQGNTVRITGYGLVIVTFYPLITEITETSQTTVYTGTDTSPPIYQTTTETQQGPKEVKQVDEYSKMIIPVVILATLVVTLALIIIRRSKTK